MCRVLPPFLVSVRVGATQGPDRKVAVRVHVNGPGSNEYRLLGLYKRDAFVCFPQNKGGTPYTYRRIYCYCLHDVYSSRDTYSSSTPLYRSDPPCRERSHYHPYVVQLKSLKLAKRLVVVGPCLQATDEAIFVDRSKRQNLRGA